MGSAASTTAQAQSVAKREAAKPADASDVKEGEALAEVQRLRAVLRKHLAASSSMDDFAKFERGHSSFRIENAPQLFDYLANEYYRFGGKDELLSWDEFWRFMKELDLGLSDVEIATLRQEADSNADGLVDWAEMLSVVEPRLAKYWQAKLEGAPEYDRWVELHWEAHYTVNEVPDGATGQRYMSKGEPFWVNKLSGESTWEQPEVIKRHQSILERKKQRALEQAPSLDDFLFLIFEERHVLGAMSISDYWNVLTDTLKLDPALTDAEMDYLKNNTDLNQDGKIDWQEFTSALTPKLKETFGKRPDHNQWIALDTQYELDGKKYLYWYNRSTGESQWDAPQCR